MANVKMTLKLLIDTESNRVLFAEAGKDFVDLLFSFLSAPMGSIIKVLTNNKMVGSIGNLYESVEKLNNTYIDNKNMLLNPKAPASSVPNSFLITHEPKPSKTYYTCASHARICEEHIDHYGEDYYEEFPVQKGNFHPYISTNLWERCPTCNEDMSMKVTHVGSTSDEDTYNTGKGYVKGVVTYTVMDDLVVTPMSTISGIALMKKFNIDNNIKSLEEIVVDFGMEQAVELLMASLQSKTALSDVFLKKVNPP